jgi:hypothetical protein
MPNSTANPTSREDPSEAAAAERAERIGSVIRTLIAELPAEEQRRLFDEL